MFMVLNINKKTKEKNIYINTIKYNQIFGKWIYITEIIWRNKIYYDELLYHPFFNTKKKKSIPNMFIFL